MSKEIRSVINLILAAIGLAMGVAVIVLSLINKEIDMLDLLRLLGIAAASLGLFALNNLPK